MLNEGKIRKLYNERRVEFEGGRAIPKSEFGPEIFSTGRVIGSRVISTSRDNPSYLRVYDFDDGSSLVLGIEGFGEIYNIHCLHIDSRLCDKYCDGYDLIGPPLTERRENMEV